MPDVFGAVKDTLSKVGGAASDALSNVLPGNVKETLFGTTEAPPTPTSAQASQSLIDNLIGHQPNDDQILSNIKALGMTSFSIPVIEQLNAQWQGIPYDPHTSAQVATGSNVQPSDPLTLANPQLQKYFKDEPRAQDVYVRNYMPLDPKVVSWAVQSNMKKSPGLLGNAVGKFTDIAGRPIGGMLDMLSKPSAYVETWYGTHFTFNDINDASLRQAMARQSYGYALNFVSDPHYTKLRQAQAEGKHIEEDLGLKGPAAAAEYERWLKQDGGNPGLAAHITDMVAQMVADPLWILPTGIFGDAAKLAGRGVTGTDDVSRLFRLANAPALLGDYTIRDILRMPEVEYRTAVLSHPASLGPLRFLNERIPARLGDAAHDSVLRYVSGPLTRAVVTDADGAVDAGKTLDAKINVLAQFSDAIRQGKLSPRATELFGANMLEDPVMAQLSVHTTKTIPQLMAREKGMYTPDVAAHIMDGLNKSPEIAQLTKSAPQELDYLLLNAVSGNARSIAADGQATIFPSWYRNGWMRIVNKQKQIMSYFSIDRPELVTAVTANNLMTYYWTVSRQATDATDIFAHTLGAEMRAGEQAMPAEFDNMASAVGLDPTSAYRIAASNTYSHEAGAVSARAVDKQYRLDSIGNLDEAVQKAHSAITQPVKDLSERGISRYLKWPLTTASRVDRATRVSAFWASLHEQLNLGMSPGRLIEGLFPDMRGALTEAGLGQKDAERYEGFMMDHIRNWAMTPGNSLADSDGLRQAWADGVAKLVANEPKSQISAYDYLTRFLRDRGYADPAVPYAARDYEPVMQKVFRDVFSKVDDIPMEQTQAQIEQLKHSYWSVDQAMAHAMHTDPILRPTTTYSAGLARAYGHDISQLEELFRGDMVDTVHHVDRYMNSVLLDWEGATPARREVIGAADDMVHGRIQRLSDIAQNSMEQLANPEHVWDRDQAWKDYWQYTEDATRDYYDKVRSTVAAVNEGNVEPIDKWYAAQESARQKHRAITAQAMRRNTEDGWDAAAQQVAGVYKQLANERAALFGVDPNDPLKVIGTLRPTAPHVRMIEEYLTYIQDHLGPDIAALRTAGEEVPAAAPLIRTPQDVLSNMANDIAQRGPTVAQRMVGNAMFKTDLVRMNYDKQYGWDGLLQMFMPYEVFSTRTAANWLIRTARQPGATALLAQSLLLPQQYAQQYGHNVAPGSIPIPIPGLTDFLSHVPFVGSQLKNANFGPIFWVDPLDMMFPMTRYLNSYNDEAKTATPGGALADWMEKNTPLGLSPFAKIVGGVSGILPRDAWTNDLFSGGPFGVPVSLWGKVATNWLHTGDPTNMPPEEMANYSTHGVFSWQFLGNILGINDKTQLDQYKAEKALAANVAEGKTTTDDAWQALKTHQGQAWKDAVKTADSAQFLQDFTGWIGMRMTGSTVGDNILLGQRALFSKAAASGDLSTFFEKYPGYEVKRAVTKGLTDKAAEQQQIDTQLYYSDIDRLVKQPYQQSLDELRSRQDAIRAHDVLTQTDTQQIQFYQKEVDSIRAQQDKIYTLIDNSYPNRNKELSLFTMPQDRAMLGAANRWYSLKQNPGEDYADFQARQQQFLNSFPAHTSQTDTSWEALQQEFLTTNMNYNISINVAAQNGDWSKVDDLVTKRNDSLKEIHDAAEKNVSRQDVEQYLSSVSRVKTQSELDFNAAKSLYNVWMSMVSTNSPLSASQKAAISAYFRQLPLLQQHYNASTIDLRSLDTEGKIALARRDVLIKDYNNLKSVDAQIDFMKQHEDEINYANQILGLPPMEIIDFRPSPPNVSAVDSRLSQLDFSGTKNLADYLYSGAAAPTRGMLQQAIASSPEGSALPSEDISRLIDAAVGSGY